MLVIQIRGTSGSGKTTAMKQIMSNYVLAEKFVSGRKKPLYYFNISRSLFILGHYESACGGCDNIGSAAKVYDLITTISKGMTAKEPVVVCEGLLLSEDVKWTLKLREDGFVVHPIFLTTSPEECVKRVIERRKQAGNDKPFNTDNTLNRVKVIERAYEKLSAQGFHLRKCRTEQAQVIVKSLIQSHLGEHS